MLAGLEDIPQGHPGSAGDVAGVVLFLASEVAAYLTGQAINVDGGLMMC
jgi:NAD(P)-dependent dehydrogenase (short-subunit alcohol dehydrogenase family)